MTATLKQGAKLIETIVQKGVPGDRLQRIVGSGLFADLLECENPEGVNREEFQKILGLYFLVTDELLIKIPALPRPTLAELKARYPWVQSIERDDSPTETITLRLATVLKSAEDSVTGSVYERRLAPRRDILLGIQHCDWLIAHQDELPEPARSALKTLLGKIYMDFPGIIVVRAGGDRLFPAADQSGLRWGGHWDWAGRSLSRLGLLAVSSK